LSVLPSSLLGKFRALLVQILSTIRQLQIFLMHMHNQVQPGIRLFNRVSKKVSIIIPNYNGEKYLGDCIDSLHRLDSPRETYEIIVVDNASSDNSVEFICSNYPDVVLIQAPENLGFARGCNLAIENSSGEYIILLNNDTIVDRNWLKELVVVADCDKDVAIAGSKLLFKHDPKKIQNAMSFLTDRGDGGDVGAHQPDEGQYDTNREVMAVCGASMLIKRSLIEDIGALDEDFFAYYEDTDLCYRARLYGKKIIFAAKSVVYHVHAGTSEEWSPFFTFLVFRNKLLLHLKNSPVDFLLKVLFLYGWQVINEALLKGVNRKTHLRVLASFAVKCPIFLLKRLYVRLILKRQGDKRILLRLTKVRAQVPASSVKKVCIYNAYLPTMGGGESQTAHMIEFVNRAFPSAVIDILCHETEAFDKSSFVGKELVQVLEKNFNISIKATKIRFENIDSNQKDFIGRMRYIYKLAAITKEYDLFINNTYSSWLPSVAKVNIYYCMFPLRTGIPRTFISGLIHEFIFNMFLSSYHLYFANSQYTQNWIDYYWGVNSFVLYPPVNILENSMNIPKDNVIINVGRFFAGGHNKKQDVLVKAFIEMSDRGWTGDWKLILVGRKHADEASKRHIRSLEETAKGYPIEFRYDTSSSELQSLLERAKIYWHATGYDEVSNLNPEKFEHFGLSTIEAAQYGVVPVVFNAGGQPEIISHAQNGILWNTTNELILYTKLLMDNESVWKNLSYAAFDSVKIFSKEKQFRWFVLFLSLYYKFGQ
jgi:GT2 family glycosyltransferase/glycosyltransferase involved in cell wall biosynthesis